MTRLIDVDAVEKITWEDPHYHDPLNVLTEVREKVRALPTVDAVPVEYILKQIAKLERSKGQSYHAICYRHLIEVWEMENERKEE